MKAEAIIRMILGPTRSNIQALAVAAEITEECLFVEGIPEDEISVTRDVYPDTARWLRRSEAAVARSVERLSSRCWDILRRDASLAEEFTGQAERYFGDPTELLVALAVYAHLNMPYPQVIRQNGRLLEEAQDAARFHELREMRFRCPLVVAETVTLHDSIYGDSDYCLCPQCRSTLEREYMAFCSCCGQRLCWFHRKRPILQPGGGPDQA